ncbi:ubiquinol-cytochrome c reductase iron-sulfur subunit [Azorhizobium doebereinerae]|uniref:ubiquinol-cytochrome c reductase iron-sulfur subunit n=1 Tax=Azorhizobium doebereinerae TaxID=281091 RepID=UPI0004045C0E|nr:ubiquinol-cytochrome c reductase iron-sulfur subunit [Azorhizobium doebereinerae]
MAHTETTQTTRRDFLYIATGAVGAVGVAGMIWPFVAQLQPDASVLALSTTEVDLSPIQEGQIITTQWRGKPIFIFNRAPKDIEAARAVQLSQLPDPQLDQDRVKKGHDNWLVVVGICTHLGCVPLGHQGNYDGWFCPCHGSQYDSSGRVRVGPAPLNLAVPPYAFNSDTKITIG